MSEDMEEVKRQQAVAAYEQRNAKLIRQHFVEASKGYADTDIKATTAPMRLRGWNQVVVGVDHAVGSDKTVGEAIYRGYGLGSQGVSAIPLAKMVELVDLLRKKEARIAELEVSFRWAKDWQAETQRRCFVRHQAMNLMQPLVKGLLETTNSNGEHAACKAALEAYEKVFAHDPGSDGADAEVVEQRAGHPADRSAAEPAGACDLQCAGKAQGETDVLAGTFIRKYLMMFSEHEAEKPQSSK